jgi:hypothetical protein
VGEVDVGWVDWLQAQKNGWNGRSAGSPEAKIDDLKSQPAKHVFFLRDIEVGTRRRPLGACCFKSDLETGGKFFNRALKTIGSKRHWAPYWINPLLIWDFSAIVTGCSVQYEAVELIRKKPEFSGGRESV